MALVQVEKKGGRYTKKEQEERRIQVYHLHFEENKSAAKIAELLNVNRNTVNDDIQYWHKQIASEFKAQDLTAKMVKQIQRMEIQRDRLLEDLENVEGFDENYEIDKAISSKMSKSDPQSAIYVHDWESDIRRKIEGAYCPPRIIEGNPIIDYSKELIFRAFDEFEIQRPQKFGGNITYTNFEKLCNDYVKGQLHPVDLKNGVIEYLDKLISPIRSHFEHSRGARRFLDEFKEWEKKDEDSD